MTLLSEIGIVLSLVLGCLLLALVAELYYLLCWKNHKFSSSNSNYSNYTKEMLYSYLFCWNKPTSNSSTPNPNPDLEMGQESPNDLVLKTLGDEDVEGEIMRLHNLAGPPRFLFTIKEETKEDLEFDRSRKGSRTKSLSDFILSLDSPINSGYNNNVTPVTVSQKGLVNDGVKEGRMYVDNYNNPLFESSKEAELFRLRSSPPPKFKFLRDAEEKLYRKLVEEAKKSVVLQEGIFNSSGKDVFLVKSEGIDIDDCSFQSIIDGDVSVSRTFEKAKYGSEWGTSSGLSPFLHSTTNVITRQDDKLRRMLDPLFEYVGGKLNTTRQRLSLHDILECDPYLDELKRVGGGSSCTSDLSEKYVGLYLCADGSFMKELKAVHDYCLRNNQQLEIVLVCISLFDDPDSFMEDLKQGLTLCNITSWFLFNYHSKICRRIWRVFGQFPPLPKDKLIILPPSGEFGGELERREIISKLGIKEYPFTRSSILNRRLEALRTLNPASFFDKGATSCLVRNGRNFKSMLQGKKLLLYLDWLDDTFDPELYTLMTSHYAKIQAMGWEVVFVPQVLLKCKDPPVCTVVLDDMPWPYMPPSDDAVCLVDQLTFPEERGECHAYKFLIAVREDGRILSREVQERLPTDGVTRSLFDDVLFQEMALQLSAILGYYN